MRFNEPVEIAFGAIRVFDTHGNRVDRGEAEHVPGEAEAVEVGLEPDLPDGTYTVTWRVISADSHPIEEAFVFHVGAPGEQPQGIAAEILRGETGAGAVAGAVLGVARWLNFAGLLVLCGALIFGALVWPKGGARVSEAGRRAFGSRFERMLGVAWGVLVVGTVVSFFAQGAVAADVPVTESVRPAILTEVVKTRFGMVAVVRLLLLAAGALVWRLWRPVGPSSDLQTRARIAVAGSFALALLATPGLAGHAGTTSPVALTMAADIAHVGSAAAWIGGLVVLLTVAFPATRRLSGDQAAEILVSAVSRYSDIAVVAVAILVVTGTYASWVQVSAFRALTGAAYGWVLLAKIGVFVPLLALGVVNNRWTKPRIERAARSGRGATAPIVTLRRVVVAEVALAAVVLVVTSLLVNLPPARIAAGVAGPFITDVKLGEQNLNVLVDPNEVGENEIHLTVTSDAGAPVRVKEMRVLMTMAEESIGPLLAEGTRLAPGHYVVQGRQLSVPGKWTLGIVARVGRFDELRTRVPVTVNG